MNVADLIRQLQEMPQDAEAWVEAGPMTGRLIITGVYQEYDVEPIAVYLTTEG